MSSGVTRATSTGSGSGTLKGSGDCSDRNAQARIARCIKIETVSPNCTARSPSAFHLGDQRKLAESGFLDTGHDARDDPVLYRAIPTHEDRLIHPAARLRDGHELGTQLFEIDGSFVLLALGLLTGARHRNRHRLRLLRLEVLAPRLRELQGHA